MLSERVLIKQLTEKYSPAFRIVCDWHYNWFGKRDNKPYSLIEENLLHSLNKGNQLPQTFVAWIGNQPVGTYQFAIMDDVDSRPDLYPWLINVYVDEQYRGKGILRSMMDSINKNAKKAKLTHLYLYTSHKALYERFGWNFIGSINTYKGSSIPEKLYDLNIV